MPVDTATAEPRAIAMATGLNAMPTNEPEALPALAVIEIVARLPAATTLTLPVPIKAETLTTAMAAVVVDEPMDSPAGVVTVTTGREPAVEPPAEAVMPNATIETVAMPADTVAVPDTDPDKATTATSAKALDAKAPPLAAPAAADMVMDTNAAETKLEAVMEVDGAVIVTITNGRDTTAVPVAVTRPAKETATSSMGLEVVPPPLADPLAALIVIDGIATAMVPTPLPNAALVFTFAAANPADATAEADVVAVIPDTAIEASPPDVVAPPLPDAAMADTVIVANEPLVDLLLSAEPANGLTKIGLPNVALGNEVPFPARPVTEMVPRLP